MIYLTILLLTTNFYYNKVKCLTLNNTNYKISYSNNQLWNTFIDNNDEKLQVILKLKSNNDISMWGGNGSAIDILIRPELIKKVENKLNENHIEFKVIIKDLQKVINEENPPFEELELDNRQGHHLTWQAYHRLGDIYGFLNYLQETYPNLCRVENIGYSVLKNPIKMIRISNNKANNNAIWIDGGIHAREWISPATVTYIINRIVTNYENEPEYIQNIDWYIVPVLNPDGYEYSHTIDRLWRKNLSGGINKICKGVDLNRNFGYHWGGKGSSRNPCTETFSGNGPFSEPEAKAVENFIRNNLNMIKWKGYLSFHSYGQYILYPWGYDRFVTSDHENLQHVGKQFANAIRQAGGPTYQVGSAANTLYPAAGGSDDWARGVANIIYTYTIELRDNGRYGFILPAKFIKPTAQETYAGINVIAKVINPIK